MPAEAPPQTLTTLEIFAAECPRKRPDRGHQGRHKVRKKRAFSARSGAPGAHGDPAEEAQGRRGARGSRRRRRRGRGGPLFLGGTLTDIVTDRDRLSEISDSFFAESQANISAENIAISA